MGYTILARVSTAANIRCPESETVQGLAKFLIRFQHHIGKKVQKGRYRLRDFAFTPSSKSLRRRHILTNSANFKIVDTKGYLLRMNLKKRLGIFIPLDIVLSPMGIGIAYRGQCLDQTT